MDHYGQSNSCCLPCPRAGPLDTMSAFLLFLLPGLAFAVWVTVLLWAEKKKKGLCVLLYHRIHPEEGPKKGSEALFSVSAKRFEEQLDALKNAGYKFLSPMEVLSSLDGGEPFPDKSILIAFDDGCDSIATLAAPLMMEREITGLVFQTTHENAFVFHLPGNPQKRCTPEQIHHLVSLGWKWGVHSVHHAPPSTLSEEKLEHDFSSSISWVENASGQSVEDYAIPGNFHSEKLMETAAKAGIKRVWSASPGLITLPYIQGALPRMGVEGTSTGPALVNSLSPLGRVLRQGLSAAKRAPVRLLGPKVWLPVRRGIFRLLAPFSLSRKFWGRILVLLTVGLILLLILVTSQG